MGRCDLMLLWRLSSKRRVRWPAAWPALPWHLEQRGYPVTYWATLPELCVVDRLPMDRPMDIAVGVQAHVASKLFAYSTRAIQSSTLAK